MDPTLPSSSGPNPKLMIAIGGVLVILLVALVLMISILRNTDKRAETNREGSAQNNTGNQVENSVVPSANPTFAKQPPSPGAVAVVGDEVLYSTDLKRILDLYPAGLRESSRDVALEQIINESIALQAGAKAGMITLSPSFYNSMNKNYTARSDAINKVKAAVDAQTGSVSGAVISIWFFNNGTAGPIGYERGKQIAKQKIEAARASVVSGDRSIIEVARIIKDDTSLAQLDPVWQQNAIFTFEDVPAAEAITFDPEFDKIIRSLKPGEVSPVRLISVGSGDGRREALYMFAQVTRNNPPKGEAGSYEEWLQMAKKSYEIERY
ncbi:MAG: peptidylprolyl isomerase [Patescibacteria group bacterium]|nr:peptidylprolyl isomerase [Patescibacteria group bacterium]